MEQSGQKTAPILIFKSAAKTRARDKQTQANRDTRTSPKLRF